MLFLSILGALDNQGREFIVGFMENDRGRSDVELFISTSRTTPVSVRVSLVTNSELHGYFHDTTDNPGENGLTLIQKRTEAV